MIELRHVTKRYDGKLAVDGLTLTVGDGEMCVLIGPAAAARRRRCG